MAKLVISDSGTGFAGTSGEVTIGWQEDGTWFGPRVRAQRKRLIEALDAYTDAHEADKGEEDERKLYIVTLNIVNKANTQYNVLAWDPACALTEVLDEHAALGGGELEKCTIAEVKTPLLFARPEV